MVDLLHISFKDLGHTIVPFPDEADIILAIRTLPDNFKRKEGQKIIFYQTEPYKIKPGKLSPVPSKEQVEEMHRGEFYPYTIKNADAYWGFDKFDKFEEYVPLGYHPSLEFESAKNIEPTHNVGFVGCNTRRRRKVFDKSKYSVFSCNGEHANTEKGVKALRSCKVNIHLNAWDKAESLTPWDRIARFLHNKCFFIMEDVCDMSIDPVVRFDLKDYEATVEKYVNNGKLRKEIAEECYTIYKRDLDMRDILQKQLDKLFK